jgi:CO dehydrogenase/acetyl-CoA synthase beta subunit
LFLNILENIEYINPTLTLTSVLYTVFLPFFLELFSTCLSQHSAEEDLGDGEGEEEEEEEEEDEECASEEENQVSVLKNCFLAMVDTLSKQVLKLSFKMNIRDQFIFIRS